MLSYEYKGPVVYYDNVISNNWTAETKANSLGKAINNLKYQAKTQSNLVSGVGGITLPGKINCK